MFRANHTPKSWSSFRALSVTFSAIFLSVMISAFAAPIAFAQSGLMRLEHDDDRDYGSRGGGFIEHDPTLDVEVWTDNESGEYYEGDEIQVYFRTNRDAYVAVYNVDSDGRVNLIYPFDQHDDPYIEGGRIYRIPGPDADYDLLVDGPAGIENIQIIASRRPFAIPDWFEGSGLVADRDRYEFMDYINDMYFGCRSGCPRALDNVSYVVKEWDNYYYRPVYYQPWPVWGSYGGIYVDYYWGSSIYIDGYYYGIAPLYLPRIGYGHHVVTIYDSQGYAWENSVRVHNTSAIHLDNTIIRTTAGTHSRFKSVHRTGYRSPAKSGYSNVKVTSKFRPRATAGKKGTRSRATTTRTLTSKNGTTSRSKINKSGGVRGFNYKSNGRSTVTTKETTTRATKTKTTRTKTSANTKRSKDGKSGVSRSSTSGKRLKSYKNAPDGGNKARVSRSKSSSKSSSSRKSAVSRKKTSSKKSSSVKRSSGKRTSASKSGRKSSSAKSGKKSSKPSKASKAGRSKSKSKSSGKSSARRSKSGSSKSSARGASRSSGSRGKSGSASRSSGSRGKSGSASRGGRSSGSKGKSKKK